jgi:hypothetical protein
VEWHTGPAASPASARAASSGVLAPSGARTICQVSRASQVSPSSTISISTGLAADLGCTRPSSCTCASFAIANRSQQSTPRGSPADPVVLSSPRDHREPGRAQDAATRGAQRRDAHREEALLDPHPGQDGPGVHRAEVARADAGPVDGVRAGRLPQHLRVLGGPRGDLPHRRRPVHPALRLLQHRHRQAGRLRHRRAAPGGRVGGLRWA